MKKYLLLGEIRYARHGYARQSEAEERKRQSYETEHTDHEAGYRTIRMLSDDHLRTRVTT